MKVNFKPIIFIGAAIVLLLGGVWFFLDQSSSKEDSKELSADEILATIVETESITTNLSSEGFIQLSFKIQTDSEKAKEELEKRDFQVRNIVLKLFSSKTEEQINNPTGMAQFEEQMKIQINKLMQNGHIVKIYTTNKVIQ